MAAAPSVQLVHLSDRVRVWAPAAVVVALFIAVSTFYNVRVPLYEAPDEAAHARYVRSIADNGKLPRSSSIAEYESWQPPLYYALGAATLKILGLDSPPELEWNVNFPAERQNFVHTSEEDFPYSEPVLAVHVLRGISTLFGAGAILLIYLTSLLIFPRRRLLAFSAAATLSLIPQFAFISATVSNDPASFFAASATVYLGLRYLREFRTIVLVLAAVAVSLGAVTKLSAAVVGIVPLAAVLFQPIAWQKKIPQLAVLALFPLAIAGWFYLRSLILWGAVWPAHLFGQQNPLPIWDSAYRQTFFETLRESFWYAGGPLNIRLSPIVYDVLDVTSVLALAGLIVTFASSRLAPFENRAIMLLSVLPVLALGMLLYFSVEHDFQPQGRYLFVAMPAFAILMPLGLSRLFSRDGQQDHLAMLALPALLLAVNVSIFAITLPRYY